MFCVISQHSKLLSLDELSLNECSPLLWASNWESELTATLHSEQYSSFLALSSSVSGLLGVTDGAPGAPVPVCSGLEEPQQGDEEVAGGG